MMHYHVKWETPSTGSEDSMPLGGYDTGCNVWAEGDSLYLYVSESGTFDENGTMLKLARLRLRLETNLFQHGFLQELHTEEGYISVDAGKDGDRIHFRLWAAVDKPEIHVEYTAEQPHMLTASLENWRFRDREVTEEERHQCRDYTFGYPEKVITTADTLDVFEDALYFYHWNGRRKTVWDAVIKQQKLEPIRDRIPNPLKNRMMGGLLKCGGMRYSGSYKGCYAGTDFEGHSYQISDSTWQDIVLTLHTACYDTPNEWKHAIACKAALPVLFEDSVKWWKRYFNKSYIFIDSENEDSHAYKLGRNYQLFRYMLGCNYYGEYPTKFNGGLFTFDPRSKNGMWTPDFRMWSGSGFTAQNQRLVYWGMLKCGDFEGMHPQFQYFIRLTDAAKARVEHFFYHPGAFFFEQGNLFGTCIGGEYGWKHSELISPGLDDNPWVRLHFSSGLEFALMMLEYARYTDEDIEPYMDYIESIVAFYMFHYQPDESGKLYLYPSTALETYKGEDPYSKDDRVYGCANPTDAVAGLRCVLEELEAYVKEPSKKEWYRDCLKRCPETAVSEDRNGNKVYLPAEKYNPKPFNCELPQLYRIFPYSPRGLSQIEKAIGRNTYSQPYPVKEMYAGCSWHQNGIFAARLGLFREAWRYLELKLGDSPRRFPAFWGPGHDWTPDHNQGGSGIIGLQEMLMQCDGEKISLFPCWDKSIDVSFKLHAPHKTVVECVLKGGRVTQCRVTPKIRQKDVVIL